MSCDCPAPIQAHDPRRYGTCLRCALPIDPAVLSSDETVRSFFDRLEATIPGKPPVSFSAFRTQCEARERAGRDAFGLNYLKRQNPQEGCEEAADLGVYSFLDTLQHRHRHCNDEDYEFALIAAFHAYKAHEAMRVLAAKRRGSP